MKTIAARTIFTVSLFYNIATMHASQATDLVTKKQIVRVSTQKDNKNIRLLLELPGDILHLIMIDPAQPLKQSLKNSLSLSATCTYLLNNLLPCLGAVHRHYSSYEKNNTLNSVIRRHMLDIRCGHKCYIALLLTNAGARHHHCQLLLEQTIQQDDLETATRLLQHGADPNEKNDDRPIFWQIKSEKMAQLFVNHGVNVNRSGWLYANVLWHLLSRRTPDINLVKFYLENKASVEKTRPSNGDNILHWLATPVISCGTKEQAAAAELLLKSCPDIINRLDNDGDTPFDLACRRNYRDPFLIELLQKYGAKRSKELKSSSCT